VLILVAAAALRFWSLPFGLDLHDPSRAVLNNLVDEHWMARGELDGLLAGNLDAGDFLARGPAGFLVFGALDAAALLPFALAHPEGWAGLRADLDANLSPLLLLHRLWSTLAGLAAVLVFARFGRRHFGERAGLIAAAFLATCYLHVRESHIGGVDVLFGMLFVCSLDALLDVARRGSRADWVRAGLLSGATAATKYFGGVLVLHALAAHLLSRRAARRRGTSPPPWTRLPLGAACMAAGMLVLSPSLVVQPMAVLRKVQWSVETFAVRPTGGGLGDLIAYHARVSAWSGLGAAVCVLAGWGAWLGLRDGGPLRVLLLFTVLALPCALAMELNAVRYALPVLEGMVLLAAVAAARLLELRSSRATAQPPPARASAPGAGRRALAAALVAGCVLPGVLRCIAYDTRVARTDTRLIMLDRLAELHAARDEVVAFGIHGLPRPSEQLPQPFVDLYREFRQDRQLPARIAADPPRYVLFEPGAPDYARWIGFDPRELIARRYRVVFVADGRVDPSATSYAQLIDSGVPTHMMPFARPQAVDFPGPVLQLYERTD